MYVSKHVAHTYSVVCKYVCIYVCMYHCFKMKRYEFFYNVFVREAWASIVGWTEGHVPPTFWNWGTEYALSPYFLKRICVSSCPCVYYNSCYYCYLAETINQSRAKNSLLRLIMSLCP